MGESRRIVEQMLAYADAHDRRGFGSLLTEDAEMTMPGMQARGRDQVVEFGRAWDRAFTGGCHTIRNLVEDGDRMVVELGWIGRHTGPLATPAGEVPATGREVTLDHVQVIRVQDGLIASSHIYLDNLGFLAGLGLVPEPATA